MACVESAYVRRRLTLFFDDEMRVHRAPGVGFFPSRLDTCIENDRRNPRLSAWQYCSNTWGEDGRKGDLVEVPHWEDLENAVGVVPKIRVGEKAQLPCTDDGDDVVSRGENC